MQAIRRRNLQASKVHLRMNLPFRHAASVSLLVLLGSVEICAARPGKTLLVVAHPDDEYYCAATIYRMAVQLGGTVDELIITNGEGGYRYSTLAEAYYKKPLTVEAVGRRELPTIRRREAINAGRVLGIRTHYFLNQRDKHFTTDSRDAVDFGWNSQLITSRILSLMRTEHYRYVFSVLPRATTHGSHQEATSLAASAIQALPVNLRPVLFGFDTDPTRFTLTTPLQQLQDWGAGYAYAFDRTFSFGFRNALTYQIVVDWMIAEHKSQGLLQTMNDKEPKEYMWIDRSSAPSAQTSADTLFHVLNEGLVHNDNRP
jgi:LmbE family N-acetylglucosaminyl deacetylase